LIAWLLVYKRSAGDLRGDAAQQPKRPYTAKGLRLKDKVLEDRAKFTLNKVLEKI
jgi:hypothetical protein